MMWMGRKIHHHAATTAARVTAGHHTMPCAVVEAVDSPGMVPKSTYNIIKVFDNIHLVWIYRWIHHDAVTTTHGDQDLTMQLNSWIAFGHQTIPLSCNWGCRPTMHGSHIHFKHYHGEWQHSYDVDDQTNPTPCHYHRSCW
jgi:hypothetical protein